MFGYWMLVLKIINWGKSGGMAFCTKIYGDLFARYLLLIYVCITKGGRGGVRSHAVGVQTRYLNHLATRPLSSKGLVRIQT